MQYTLHKTLTGKLRLKYACPHCKESLESELAEAGSKDQCPQCGGAFVVPGEEKRKEVEALLRQQLEARKKAEAEKAAKEAEQREAARQQAALQQQALERKAAEQRAAEQAAAAAAPVIPPLPTQPAAPAPSLQLASSAEPLVEENPYSVLPPRRNRKPGGSSSRSDVTSSGPSNVRYPALELYILMLKICGYICLAGVAITIIAYGVAVAIMLTRLTSIQEWIGAAIGLLISSVSFALPALFFFVMSQLLQLLLDARRDLAKLVTDRQE